MEFCECKYLFVLDVADDTQMKGTCQEEHVIRKTNECQEVRGSWMTTLRI